MMQGQTKAILDFGGVDDSEKESSFTLNTEAALCSEKVRNTGHFHTFPKPGNRINMKPAPI
jgi:hypothetical protein